MTTADAEPVAGASHVNSHVKQMTSQVHLDRSHLLQSTTVCLPVMVQQLTYHDNEFTEHDNHDNDDDDDNDDDGDSDGDGDCGPAADYR